MKLLATAVLLLATSTLAQTSGRYFSLVAASANKDLHMKPINAAGQQLWIDKATSSYCPIQVVGEHCPPGNVTSFGGGEGTMGMNTMVPGGQRVYVNGTGSIKFTQAHSAHMDTGAVTNEWQYLEQVTKGYGQLIWAGQHGFLACPDGADGSHHLKVFTGYNVPGGCTVVDLLVPDAGKTNETAAWQYI